VDLFADDEPPWRQIPDYDRPRSRPRALWLAAYPATTPSDTHANAPFGGLLAQSICWSREININEHDAGRSWTQCSNVPRTCLAIIHRRSVTISVRVTALLLFCTSIRGVDTQPAKHHQTLDRVYERPDGMVGPRQCSYGKCAGENLRRC
jgi:hypothetical protein